MISTLQSQLHFVRAIQRVDTTGVEPLQAIRDETEAGRKEATISLEDLKDILDKETLVGHYKRPRRVKEELESESEQWDPLSTASRKAGKYFVVDAAKKEGEQ
jgi:Asp-tRNA(Asn)/Glu-tRNA(Gln) amidotransferase C subunit